MSSVDARSAGDESSLPPEVDSTLSYSPTEGAGLAHDPFNSIVGPRPIGWIGSISSAGDVNLAPYSFFNGLNYKPLLIGFSSIGYKDSVTNIKQTETFTWNLVTRGLAEQMNLTSLPLPPTESEFDAAGLALAKSDLIDAPRVAASPVSFECRLAQIVALTGADGSAAGAWFVVGEVVRIHILRSLVADGVYETSRARPILRGGGPADYFTIDEAIRFTMPRPGQSLP